MNTVTITGRTQRAQMTIPEYWSAEDVRDEIELLAVLRGKEGAFAPNLVVTLNPFEGPMAGFMASAVGNIVQTLGDVRFVDIILWNPGAVMPGQPAGDGRAITYTHVSPASGEILRTTEWLFVGRGLAVQATGTTAAPDWMVIGPELEQMASSLVLSDDAGPHVPVVTTLPDGALDTLASEELGYPVESISGIGQHQQYEYSGEWVHAAAFALLDEMAEGFKIGRLNADAHQDDLLELARVGLASGTALTDTGEFLRSHLKDPDASFRISGGGSLGATHYQAWAYGPTVLVAAGAGFHAHTGRQDPAAPTVDHVNLKVVPISALARDIADWVGLAPAWSLPALPAGQPREQFVQRWAGNTEPPADANPVLTELWKQNWFSWEIQAQGRDGAINPVSYLHGGSLGQYRLGAEDATTWLVPTPSVYVYDQLDDAIAAAVFGRPVQLH